MAGDGEYREEPGFPRGLSDVAVEDVTIELHPGALEPAFAEVPGVDAIGVGSVLRDRYVILEKLGSGGKGTVFRALDRYRTSLSDSRRHVALKVLHAGGAGTVHAVTNLSRELEIGQVLSHRNIVKMFELDRDGETVFFTMELLEGELLSSLISRMAPRGMEPRQAWQIIRQLGAGVQHAHEQGIVHGDLKPRNILVTRNGELRILDFGSARTSKVAWAALNPGEPVSGTPAYASCELLEGRDLDSRDDLYAVACISYELLTSAHPFAHRPAVVARNFGVKARRPAGISSRQWRTLQAGLSWHRAGRSASVGAWTEKLTHGIARPAAITPLQDLEPASTTSPVGYTRAAVAMLAAVLIGGAAIRHGGAVSDGTVDAAGGAVSAGAAGAEAVTPVRQSPGGARPAAPAVAAVPGAPAAPPTVAVASITARVPAPSVKSPPIRVSVDGYTVSSGDRFVEIRAHRNQWRHNASFVWWTESATAKQDVDFVHQASAVQTFAAGRRSTRFYVKLLPETSRLQRDFFYIAIAQPGDSPMPNRSNPNHITRAQIWLPAARDQLQARR